MEEVKQVKDAFKLGLVQTVGRCSDPDRFRRLTALVKEAKAQGAQVVLLPELILNDYFCIEEHARHFDEAHRLEDAEMKLLQNLAREEEVALVAPFFEKRDRGVYHNSAAVFDVDGTLLGLYRKMHIPDDPGFYEKYYFAPGDLGFKVFETRHARIGVLICWDQWFPEAARLTALQGCDVLLYPTAIGWDAKECELLPGPEGEALRQKQLDGWITMHRSHAIANGVYVAAANRIGPEGHLQFWGNSHVCDPGGEVVARLSAEEDGVLTVLCRGEAVEEARRIWPFLRDRRIDKYQGLLERFARG